jgi:glycosyltransferase involved in cell wall biosynthesis
MLVSKDLGGAGLIALQLAAAMRERVREICVWVPGEGPAAAKAREMGVAWREYDPTRALASSKVRGALCNWQVGQLLRRHRPGLIHIHSPFYYGALSLGLKISQLKSVVHVQIEEEEEGLRWALKQPPNVIITCARFLVEQVRRALPLGYQESQPIIAIPNSIDTIRFRPGDKTTAKARLGVSPQTSLVVMVANLSPHKGQETALKAAAILKEKGVSAQFWFAGMERGGRKEYTSRLQALVNDLGLSGQVEFLGQREDIPELLRAADALILPSLQEGLPLSILEAQASKVPVVAAPTAGVPEVVIHGKTGFLVEANDPSGYAHYLYSLLHNQVLHAHIAEDGYRAIVKGYSWKTFVERVHDVYQAITRN